MPKEGKKKISTLHVHGLSRQSYHDRYVKIDTAYETFFRCFSISGSRFLATVGTLSIRCTNLSWPKRLLLHYLHDFVGCFAFVDADTRNAMSTRRLMPKLDELYCFSAVPELINNNLLTVCRRQSSISAVSRNFFSISDNQGSKFYIQHSP